MTKLEGLAFEVAIIAPRYHAAWSTGTSIPWAVIEEIRTDLEHQGIDWKAAQQRMKAIKREREVAKFKGGII